MEEIVRVVHHFILREFLAGEDPEELTPETPLITGGILDSISTLKVVTFLEDHFRITIEAHEAGIIILTRSGGLPVSWPKSRMPRQFLGKPGFSMIADPR